MRHLSPLVSPLLLTAAACLAAYGGYGAGLGRAGGAGLAYWLQVAAAMAVSLVLFGAGLWRSRPAAGGPAGSLSEDLGALERLVPTLCKHPDGLPALQHLIEVLFEARHRSEAGHTAETLVEKEGRRNA